MLENNKIYCGDCLKWMGKINDKSIDMILTDLPYGNIGLKWDVVIPFDLLWEQYKRIIKDKAVIVLTAAQPFTTSLISSNFEMFKYCLVWNKKNISNPFLSKKQPLRIHEDICVFYKKNNIYNPQMRKGKMRKKGGAKKSNLFRCTTKENINDLYYPVSILEFPGMKRGLHPTQKPVELFEYLIKTYSNEDDLILDTCAGSFTTAVACDNLKRKWICIEKEKKYCQIGLERIKENRKKLRSDT